jgi:hypothetical protein
MLTGRLVLSNASALAAGGEPTIYGVSAYNVTEHSATLQAQIDPMGLETKYELWIEYGLCHSTAEGTSCGAITVEQVAVGYIPAGPARDLLPLRERQRQSTVPPLTLRYAALLTNRAVDRPRHTRSSAHAISTQHSPAASAPTVPTLSHRALPALPRHHYPLSSIQIVECCAEGLRRAPLPFLAGPGSSRCAGALGVLGCAAIYIPRRPLASARRRVSGSVMDQLGHTDPAFTLRVHRHGMRRDPASKRALREPVGLPVEQFDWAVVGLSGAVRTSLRQPSGMKNPAFAGPLRARPA